MIDGVSVELRFGIALVVGLVIGAEREQRMAEGAHKSAGIRTFAIAALLGAVGAQLGAPALVLLGAAVAAGTMLAYALGDRSDPGLTSELALVLTFGLGALAISEPHLALAAGITTALLLAFRSHIHSVVRDVLTPTELRDALIVAAASLVVLPLVPDATIDPWGVFNPFVLWRLVVVILSITLAAYVAQRMLGPRWGLALAGLASGFVSSSATIAAMGQKAKADERTLIAAVAAAAASTIATFVQLAALVAAASPALLAELTPALASGMIAAIAYAGWLAYAASREEPLEGVGGRAVNLRGALIFALLVTGVTLASSLMGALAGDAGAVVAATIASLADAHASAASIASLHAADRLSTDGAILGVLACLSINSITKAVLAFTQGSATYARRVILGVALALAASWIGWGAGRALGDW